MRSSSSVGNVVIVEREEKGDESCPQWELRGLWFGLS